MNSTLIEHDSERMADLRAVGLADWSTLLEAGVAIERRRGRSGVWRIEAQLRDGLRVLYLKRTLNGALRAMGPIRFDRGQRELLGTSAVESAGWIVPHVVASGHEMFLGRRKASFLLTDAITCGQPLHEAQGDIADEMAAAFLSKLAALHAEGVTHGDLRWRNIFVIDGERTDFALLDCARARRHRPSVGASARARDLGLFLVDARIRLTPPTLNAALGAYFDQSSCQEEELLPQANRVADRSMRSWRRFRGASQDELRQVRGESLVGAEAST